MIRELHIAVLILTLVACPLRCAQGCSEKASGECGDKQVGESAGCACCRGHKLADEKPPRSDRPIPSDCRCTCLCKGATLGERSIADDGAQHSAPIAVLDDVAANALLAADRCHDIASIASSDQRPSGRSLRFLIASLLI